MGAPNNGFTWSHQRSAVITPTQPRQPLLGTPINVRLRVSFLFLVDTFVALISNIFISPSSLLLRMPLTFYFLIVIAFVMYSVFTSCVRFRYQFLPFFLLISCVIIVLHLDFTNFQILYCRIPYSQ